MKIPVYVRFRRLLRYFGFCLKVSTLIMVYGTREYRVCPVGHLTTYFRPPKYNGTGKPIAVWCPECREEYRYR